MRAPSHVGGLSGARRCSSAAVRKGAGIEDMRLHGLRYTYASHAVLQSVPPPVVSRLLGQERPEMTLRYAHVDDRAPAPQRGTPPVLAIRTTDTNIP